MVFILIIHGGSSYMAMQGLKIPREFTFTSKKVSEVERALSTVQIGLGTK